MEVYEYLVGSAAFKAVGTSDPRPAGSIPVHLRHRSSRGLRRFAAVVVAVLMILAGCASTPTTETSADATDGESEPVASDTPEAAAVPAPTAAPTSEAAAGESTTAPTVAPTETVPEPTAEPTPTPAPTPAAPEPTAVETAASESAEPEPAVRCRRVTDFAGELQQQSWRDTLDGVMGGRSSGQVAFTDSTMVFVGEIVTQGGGFSLVRTSLFAGDFDDGSFLSVRARTDGRRYEMVFKDGLEGRRSQLFHEAMVPLAATADWQEVRVELVDLLTTSNGRTVEAAPFEKDAISEMGIILKDGIDGAFTIELDWIDICAQA